VPRVALSKSWGAAARLSTTASSWHGDLWRRPLKRHSGADAAVIATDWPIYGTWTAHFTSIAYHRRQNVIIDGERLLRCAQLKSMGYLTERIGDRD